MTSLPGMNDDTPASRLESAAESLGREQYTLILFVAGASPSSSQAVARIHAICDRYLEDRYELEVVDVHQQPERADRDNVFAVPTLLKKLPVPLRRIIGDLSDEAHVLVALGIVPRRDA
jgi:circadian clock protein KaiB